MKISFLTLLFFAVANLCLAQQSKYAIVDKDNNPTNYGVNALKSKISLIISVNASTTSIYPFNNVPNDSLGNIVFLENAQKALLTVRLRKDSLKYYRYTIIENDTKVIVKDAIPNKINFVWNERSDFPGYLTMDLGLKDISHKKVTVRIYRLPEIEKVSTVIIYNKSLQRAKVLKAKLVIDTVIKGRLIRKTEDLDNGASFLSDSKIRYLYIPIQKTDLDIVYYVHIFRVYGDHNRQIALVSFAPAWQYNSSENDTYFLLVPSFFKEPGEYRVHIVPKIGDAVSLPELYDTNPQLTFSVLKGPKVYSMKDVIIIGGGVVIVTCIIASFVIFTIKRRAFNTLETAKRKAETTKEQLEHIRSQLNPHFIYNSLSGIQNFINKNEVENANTCLSKFARLTRNVLDEKELISIDDERNLLDDYLSIEQLRFGFEYKILIDENSNLLPVEIPTMLMQPFAENASKHSMSLMGTKGKLIVEFLSIDKDLILKISDNGKGFNVNDNYEGLGLKLCKKRIDLLNELYPECPLLLMINSGESGTVVNITLKNWL
jgi:two-component system LytT family sensor kinase